MMKLLSAEFTRLFKSFIFKLGLLFSGGLGAFCVFMRWLDTTRHPEVYESLPVAYRNADGIIFVGSLYLIFAAAVFIGIFVGTEYSDGTIRNKLVVGHTRTTIYLSKFIVCVCADILMCLLNIAVILILGYLLIDGTTMPIKDLLLFTATTVTALVALTALLLLFAMSIQSKAAGSIVCLLTVLIMLFAAMTISNRLQQPEYSEPYSYFDETTGEVITTDREKNPAYVSGTKRKVYEFLDNFLPASQLYQLVQLNAEHAYTIMLYDCVIVLLTTGAGIIIFKKKNLR